MALKVDLYKKSFDFIEYNSDKNVMYVLNDGLSFNDNKNKNEYIVQHQF